MTRARAGSFCRGEYNMKDINQKILDYCMDKWNKGFDGINSYNVASRLGLDHEKVRKAFKKLRRKNKGTLRENITVCKLKNKNTEVITTVFFPSKESLKESFRKSKMATQRIPEFKKRLHLGHRRNELAYFSKSVLSRYYDLTDKFKIQDSFLGGFISSNYESSGSKSTSKKSGSVLRFGKRKLDTNEQVITAVLDDLAKLPESEQKHWLSSEIKQPKFSLFDVDFHKYYLRYYEGAPVHTGDPLNGLLNILKKINDLPDAGGLFKNLDVQLQYPVGKVRDDFYLACERLYNVVGPPNLNTAVLKKFLHKNYNYGDIDFLDEKGRPLENDKLFNIFLKEVGYPENSLDNLIHDLKKRKIPFSEKEQELRQNQDFLGDFKELCESLLISFTILFKKLKH